MNPSEAMQTWLRQHRRDAQDALRALLRSGPGPWLTVLMMGCTLALPAALYVLVDNARGATADWQEQFSVSVYLKPAADPAPLADALRGAPQLQSLDVLSADQALAEFRAHAGFGATLDLLGENPLPAVLILWPRAGIEADVLQQWLDKLPDQHAAIELIDADSGWLQRLQALIAFGEQLLLILGVLLGLTVVLVVGNTIRLDIQNRRDEIVVLKLIGAPDDFIQRPLLYSGSLYGLFSGIVACLSVIAILALLEPRIRALTTLYQAENWQLAGLDVSTASRLIAAAIVLGWLGAWQCVRRHLRAIEPS